MRVGRKAVSSASSDVPPQILGLGCSLAVYVCTYPLHAQNTLISTPPLGCPSVSFAEIEGWQSAVAFFLKRQHLRADLIEHLKQVGDISRIVQRFTLKRGDVSDLLSVKKTIDLWEQMIKRLELEKDIEKRKRTKKDWEHIDLLRKRIRILETLADRIQSAVADANDQESESVEEEEQKAILQESTPLAENSVKWTIKPSYVREVRTQ